MFGIRDRAKLALGSELRLNCRFYGIINSSTSGNQASITGYIKVSKSDHLADKRFSTFASRRSNNFANDSQIFTNH